jgi:copper chaperone CopZ
MMSETRLRVPDMTCDHCTAAVSRAIKALPGVTTVTVDLDTKLVRVDHDRDRAPLAGLTSAVEDQGYEVTGWDER